MTWVKYFSYKNEMKNVLLCNKTVFSLYSPAFELSECIAKNKFSTFIFDSDECEASQLMEMNQYFIFVNRTSILNEYKYRFLIGENCSLAQRTK